MDDLWDGIFPNHYWKTLAKPNSAPPSLAAHPSLLVLPPARSMCQRTRGPFQSLKNISDQILYKKTHPESKVDVNPTSSLLMHLLLRFNLASPIITYHPCHPLKGSTPWLPIPCLHLSHLDLFAIVLPRNQLNPPLQRSAIRASEDWELISVHKSNFCWFILVFILNCFFWWFGVMDGWKFVTSNNMCNDFGWYN